MMPRWVADALCVVLGAFLGVFVVGLHVYVHAHDDDPYPHAP